MNDQCPVVGAVDGNDGVGVCVMLSVVVLKRSCWAGGGDAR